MAVEKRTNPTGSLERDNGKSGESEVLDSEILTMLLALDNFQGVFLAELIDIYTNTLPELCKQITQALEEQKFRDMSRLAHKAKGMSLSLGSNKLVELFGTIETGSSDEIVNAKTSLLEKMSEEYSVCTKELKDEWYRKDDYSKRRLKSS